MSWFINLVPWYFFCYFFSSFSNFFWCKYKWKKKILKKATLENASNLTPTRVYLKLQKNSLHLYLVIFSFSEKKSCWWRKKLCRAILNFVDFFLHFTYYEVWFVKLCIKILLWWLWCTTLVLINYSLSLSYDLQTTYRSLEYSQQQQKLQKYIFQK